MSTVPDVQLLLAGAPLTAQPYLQPFRQPYQDGFGGRVVMLHPESRGELVLASADPGDADPHPAEFHVDRARMENAARRHAADARHHAPAADGAVRRTRA